MSPQEPSPRSQMIEIDPSGRVIFHVPQPPVTNQVLASDDEPDAVIPIPIPPINFYCPNVVKGCGAKLDDVEVQPAEVNPQ